MAANENTESLRHFMQTVTRKISQQRQKNKNKCLFLKPFSPIDVN